jgi:4-hydroxy-tetrahydrodipicolinate synthase
VSAVPSPLELRGVHVPLITPFAADGSVALDAVASLSHHYLDAGATGIVALGTTGDDVTHYALEGAIFVTGAAVQWLRDGLGIIDEASEIGR